MKRIRCYLLLLLLTFLSVPIVAGAQESKFQAIFLFKFIENVSWPDSRKNLVIGFIGETEVHSEFDKMLKVRGNSALTLKKITADDAGSCDVIFLSASKTSDFSSLIDRTNGKSILIITETSDMAKKGAGIVFLKDGNKMSFAVNKPSLDARNLRVSLSLLTLGKQI